MSRCQEGLSTEIDSAKLQSVASRERRLKICHIAATTQGATWLFEQLRELRDRYGHDVAVVLNGSEGPLIERFKVARIPVYTADFDFTSDPQLSNLSNKATLLAALLQQHRFDVIQTHLFHSMVVGRIAAWMANVPVRLSMVAGPFHLNAYTSRWIDRTTCWMDTAILPSCQYSRTIYRDLGVSDERLSVIYYGPDAHHFDPSLVESAELRRHHHWPDNTPLIGMIAYFYGELGVNRWTPQTLQGKSVKGHEDLIRAAPIVLQEYPHAKFLLVGGGWHESGHAHLHRMQSLVKELGLQDSVIFAGLRSDIPKIYRDLDVSVQPSLNENLGGTIELLLMECPTVATKTGGMTNSIIDGQTGILVNPGDPSDLAQGILRALRDPIWAKELAKAGRSLMLSRFTLETTVADLDKLYQSLSSHSGSRLRFAIARKTIGRMICFGVTLRLLIIDLFFLPRWDQGWRPWRLSSWIALYPVYSALDWVAPSLGLRNRLHTVRATPRMWLYRGWALWLRNGIHALRALPRMWLYRGYARIGRMLGSLHRARRAPILQNSLCAARTMPRMWLYRLYAYLSRRRARLGNLMRYSAMQNGIYAIQIMPKMLLYRGYAHLSTSAHRMGVHDKILALRATPRMCVYGVYALISRLALKLGLRDKLKEARE